MYIKSFRVRNYKSFADSELHELSPGFNVILGQNNAGKTALIEALSLFPNGSKPHRESSQRRNQLIEDRSLIDLGIEFTPREMRDAWTEQGTVNFPIPYTHSSGNKPRQYVDDFLKAPRSFLLGFSSQGDWSATYPSHGMFSPESEKGHYGVQLVRNKSLDDVVYRSLEHANIDDLHLALGKYFRRYNYSFRAERMSVGVTAFGQNKVLAPDANNLPEVLNILQSQPYRFQIFNRYVKEIFPNIASVTIEPESSNQVRIKIWNSISPPDRDDLAQPLSESGTGIGQVLAILYILVTSETPQVIIIDEPNTFLHPGAVRRLFEIMRANDVQHQFIISTHSPDVIGASGASQIHLIEWKNERSEVSTLTAKDSLDMRRALSEVGARFSDVFGADYVLWVEGPIEALCFPIIYEKFQIDVPIGTITVPVVNTGDLEARRKKAELAWQVYERLSKVNALMPITVAFSFDRELRNNDQIEALKKQSSGLINFLPRRTFENYLLVPGSIASLLNELPTFEGQPITADAIKNWIEKNGRNSQYCTSGDLGGPFTKKWISEVNAPALLSDLFTSLSENREYFDKVRDCPKLTKLIADSEPKQLQELADYISNLLKAVEKPEEV